MLCRTFGYVVNGSEPNKLTWLMVYFYAIDLRLNKIDSNLAPVRGIFRLNDTLSSMLLHCNEKLDSFQREIVCSGITIYDIMSINLNSLILCLNDPDNYAACEKLHASLVNKKFLMSHEYIILERVSTAIERNKRLNEAMNFLNDTFVVGLRNTNFSRLPESILLKILGHFNPRELRKITSESMNWS